RQAGLSNVKWRGHEGRGLGVATFDVNTDGRVDLFVSNDLSPNYLFINQGNGKFRDMAMPMDAAYGLSGDPLANMGIAVGDYNDDAHADVLVTEFQRQGYVLYRNNGGMDFTNVSGTTGVFKATLPFLAFGTGFVDTRNNGSLDLFFANGHVSPNAKYQDPTTSFKQRNQLMLNDGKGQFTDVPAVLPKDDIRVHRGASFGDYDNDGRIDILVTAADDRPTLLHNQSTAGNWLILELTNKQGCATPIGTRCVATINGQKKMRLMLGGGSYASESDHRVHFGLGNADKVEKLEIQWLSGHKQTLENIEANQILSLREGSSPS
ncbi:MAG TPA: CRTAC1 family protein, partial [Abditibacteriaceae bacterium]